MKYLLSLSGILFYFISFAQQPNGCKILQNGHQFSDDVLIQSIRSNLGYELDSNRMIYFTDADSGLVCYSFIPTVLSDTVQTYSQSEVLNLESFETKQQKKGYKQKIGSKLKTNGAITRGLAVGNNSGNGVDSRLNLSLEGELTKDVFIKAYVSDQDIPIQPDGVTQNAQDLDRIYVSLYTQNKGVRLGDIALRDSTHFLRYLRNLQGASVFTNSKDTTFDLRTKVGIGVSKGKFFSNQLKLRSGVLGPYKIEGPSSNKFTVVISASEKVFLDGRLLTRGKDYIFDYNQSLITFLPHILITEYARVRIDFEYSDLDYFRVNSKAQLEYEQNKLQFKIAYYNEQDNPNKPINSSFSQQDLEQLSELGDNTASAFISGQSDVSNINSGIWYRNETVGGQTVLVYTSDLDSAEFEVRFSDVGLGNGDYDVINRELNGVIYGYVGKGQGAFLPLVPVALPHKKQMLVATISYEVNKNVSIGNEVAYSVMDKNRYARLGDDDNEGFANNFNYSVKGLLDARYKMTWVGNVEFIHKNFEKIDRFRNVDFDRNWGTNSGTEEGLVLTNQTIKFQKNEQNSFRIIGSLLDKNGDNSGYQIGGGFSKSVSKNMVLSGKYEQTETRYLQAFSNWEKRNVLLAYKKKDKIFQLEYSAEHNKTQQAEVMTTTQYFDQFALKWSKDKKITLSSAYRVDKDTVANSSEFRNRTEAVITQARYTLFDTRNQLLEVNAIHRYAKQRVGFDEQLQGGFTFRSKLKSYLTQKITYSLSSAQELQREFVFVQVAFGKGSHRFIDFDGDGKQSINEFVEDDIAGDYIKVIVPTNDFIEVFKASLKYQGSWDLRKSKIKPLSLFSGQFVFNGSDRTQSNELLTRLTPIKGDNSRAYNQQYLAAIYFHRGKGWYELYAKLRNQDVFNQYLRGEDKRETNTHTLGVRNKLNTITLNSYYEWGVQEYGTTIVADNNYTIKHQAIKEEVSKIFKRKLSLTLLSNYELKKGQKIEKATFFEIGLRSRLLIDKVGLNTNFSYVGIEHNASIITENTQEGFVLLDGLRKGANYRWSLSIQKKITKAIQLNISYQGRKPNEQKVYHIGRAQATAYF